MCLSDRDYKYHKYLIKINFIFCASTEFILSSVEGLSTMVTLSGVEEQIILSRYLSEINVIMTSYSPSAQDQIEFHYRELLPRYQGFASRLHALLTELTVHSDIHIDHLEQRVKSLKSFIEKVERKKYYDNPFDQIKDIAGIRIVTCYQNDVEKVRELIRKEFVIDEDHSVDKTSNFEADRFGYRSLHLIISLSGSRVVLDEWKRFTGLPAEIQVRSLLQHAWAVFSRAMDYKVPSQAPNKLRRRLFALSAQLETADEEITRLRNLSQEIVQGYKAGVSRDELELPLDLDSLREFIEQKVEPHTWATWERIGVEAGMEPLPPFASKFHSTGFKILLQTLQVIGISTIAQLENLLLGLERHTEPLQKFVTLVNAKGGTIHAVPIDILILLISFAKARVIPSDFDWWGKYEPFFIEALWEVINSK